VPATGEAEAVAEPVELPSLTNSIGTQFKLVPAGTFMMGESKEEQHEVTLTKPFYMGVYEVTNAEWKRVMGGVSSNSNEDDRPVVQVTWLDAVQFCQKLSALPKEREAGRVYRLPTEAEWEYACRAGTKTAYSFGDDDSQLREYGWFDKNSGGQLHPVGHKKSNPWGLYDMHGNVWEWCSDRDGDYADDAVVDPQGPPAGSLFRVVRGGCYRYPAGRCRSAYRNGRHTHHSYDELGFRLALSPSGGGDSPSRSIDRVARKLELKPVSGQADASRMADKLAASESHAFVCLPNGRVVAWGRNEFGTLDVPAYLTNAVAVAAGWKHALALTRDGKVVAWGNNEWGQCNVPAGLSDVMSIRAAGGHSLALRRDGTVVAWGQMRRINRDAAAELPKDLGACSAISADFAHNLAVQQTGEVVAWGEATDYDIPPTIKNVREVFAHSNCDIHCDACITNDGQVLVWGNSRGISSRYLAALEPPPLAKSIKAVCVGLDVLNTGGGAILMQNGALMCWPINADAMMQERRPASSPRGSPYMAASGATDIVAAAVGPSQVVALTRGYKIRIWGSGRLGDVPPELR
jgi:formylglycine-generating enzyme required for sulfatase activity